MFGWSKLDEEKLQHMLCLGMLWMSPFVFLVLYFVFPPNWGKTYKTLLGPTVPPRIGWCLFEIPNLYWALISWTQTEKHLQVPNLLLLGLFVLHYINRAIIYPLTLNVHSKPLPLEIVLAAHLYTNINGYVQSQALCQFILYPDGYLWSPFFLLGISIFFTGVFINWQSDNILRNLRKGTKKSNNDSSGSGYVIPHGGFFAYVSNPHYFGEIIEWTGFAIASQTLAAWAFVAFTCANLIPRAVHNHRYYLTNFKDYPRARKAVIPFVW